MSNLSFKPKQITKKLISVLPERSVDVIIRRYGLSDEGRKTLDYIGKGYGITRERVRQIENNAIKNIKKSDIFTNSGDIFLELEDKIDDLGNILAEEDILNQYEKDRDHVHFLMVLGDQFNKRKEDEKLKVRWYINEEVSSSVENALNNVYKNLSNDDLVSEEEMISMFSDAIEDLPKTYNEESLRRWLNISKKIGRNTLNEWGLADSSNINLKGIRDYAYLTIRQSGSPLHFREVASAIEKDFGKTIHIATCHNELIKDPRFVLVGRGLYGLTDWGYKPGTVKDVIKDILKKEGPMDKDTVIEKVMKERHVKPNTIVVNLQNPRFFKREGDLYKVK